jgi:hypothetical protein
LREYQLLLYFVPRLASSANEPPTYESRSTPAKRSQPKDGSAAKAAPSAEELAEWKEGLEECLAEVKKLEGEVKF